MAPQESKKERGEKKIIEIIEQIFLHMFSN
jgi:hypothetical protein